MSEIFARILKWRTCWRICTQSFRLWNESIEKIIGIAKICNMFWSGDLFFFSLRIPSKQRLIWATVSSDISSIKMENNQEFKRVCVSMYQVNPLPLHNRRVRVQLGMCKIDLLWMVWFDPSSSFRIDLSLGGTLIVVVPQWVGISSGS